ncbi:sulfite exporter TauE/SafE family protein [Anaerobacillus sp. MEB173]|uniref:sulfite exporter TauE/SafE family protein n=1 Tax=Anaerobacillus sp. MEB173 TaxID=3383345 RepID=UPI003F93E683
MFWELIFIFLIILIGSFIQSSSGFGMGLFAMGLLPLILPLKDSSLLVISMITLVSLSVVIRLYKYIELKGFIVILIAALSGRVLSFLFLTSFDEIDVLKKWLGFLLISMVFYLLFNKKRQATYSIIYPIVPIILGFIGGFIGGVFAVGGPFFVFYFMMLYKEKHSYNANLQTTFFISNLLTIVLHLAHGDLNSNFLLYFIIGVLSVLIGTKIGLHFFEKISREQIQKYAMVIIFLAACNLIFLS